MQSSAPSRLVVALCFALLCLIWGSTWVVIKGGLDDLPPFRSAAWRFVLAAVLMLAIAPSIARREGGRAPTLGLSFVQGTTNFALSYGIVYWAETILPSGLVSVLWAVYPLLMGLAGHFFLSGERLGRVQAIAFVVGFAGVALLFRNDLALAGPESIYAGAILLLSPLLCAIGTTLIKRAGPGISAAYLNRNGLVIGAGMLLAYAFLFERDVEVNLTGAAIGSIVYLAIGGTVLTFQLYFWLLRWVPAYKMSLIAFVTPAIALFLGTTLRGEPVGSSTLVGLILILCGCAGVLRPFRRAARE